MTITREFIQNLINNNEAEITRIENILDEMANSVPFKSIQTTNYNQ